MSQEQGSPSADTAALVARLGDALGRATHAHTMEAELDRVLVQVRSVFDAAACSFAAMEPDGASLRFLAATGAGSIVGTVVPVSRGIAGWTAMSGDSMSIADVASDTRFARDIAESTGYVPTAILAAPVIDAGGTTLGVLEVLDAGSARDGGGSRDTGHDLAVLDLTAAQLATTIRLSALFDSLGTGLLRTLVDPEGSGRFDTALGDLASHLAGGHDEDDSTLASVAEAFRLLADRGPAEAGLAERILTEVAAYTRTRR